MAQHKSLMQNLLLCLVLLVIATTAIPTKAEDQKKRVKDKSLSDESHEANGEHNAEYDHEAFLGKEESHRFDQLSPEESTERLGKIVDKIDKNDDGFVSEDELKDWIQYVQKRYIISDTDRMWKDYEITNDNEITWDAYMKRTYGFTEDSTGDNDQLMEYKDMINRDRRRWERAAKSDKKKLTKEEFSNFLHPEDAEHMREIVVLETLEDIDKDKDGYISVDEYIGDMLPDHKSGEPEPEWVENERTQFNDFRDKNKDGKMDKHEVMDWIIPADYDHSEAEAKHLIFESDGDKDGRLTKAEILEKHDLFVGSQATDFGEALTRHDEF